MPVMGGFETAQLIRQRPRSELTPLIFVTALDQAETDMGRGYNLGAVDFVFAPVVPAILRAKVSVFVELYRAQQELRRYRTQLETLVEERTIALTAINRELEAFSYSVSHDLRGPLVSFDAMSQKMLESYGGQLDQDATANLERMREASKRMTSVFDGLQMLFRLTSGEIRREQTDISALATQIVQEQQAEYPDRKVDVDIAAGISVNADKRLVRILVSNLINNSLKFTCAVLLSGMPSRSRACASAISSPWSGRPASWSDSSCSPTSAMACGGASPSRITSIRSGNTRLSRQLPRPRLSTRS